MQGKVYIDTTFKFKDGEIGKKLFVILNTQSDLLSKSFNKTVSEIGQLKTDTFGAIRNCIKRMKDDISTLHYTMLFK